MTVLRAAAAWLKKAWDWLVMHWKWLLPLLAALFWLLLRQKKVVVESGEIVGHDQAVADADAKEAAQVTAVEAVEVEKLKQVDAEHDAAVTKLNDKLKAEADKAVETPEDTNSFLNEVGEDMRK